MQGVIREGDKLSSGGIVQTGVSSMPFMGRGVACQGDKVFCPLPGHGINEIAEDYEGSKYLDRPIAQDGHRCACGRTLIASLPQAGRR
jgi:uncharacterized Zn-binding protein involved in type VI secretion